jgi:hypothetical protein
MGCGAGALGTRRGHTLGFYRSQRAVSSPQAGDLLRLDEVFRQTTDGALAALAYHSVHRDGQDQVDVWAIFATLRFARAEEWLALLGGKHLLSQSPLYQQCMAEKECETNQAALIRFLKARFGEVPEELAAQIRTVTDPEQLGRGIDHAAVCTSLKDFRKRFARK